MVSFLQLMELVGQAVDAAGVAAIVLGILLATFSAAQNRRRGSLPVAMYQSYWQGIGRAILYWPWQPKVAAAPAEDMRSHEA